MLPSKQDSMDLNDAIDKQEPPICLQVSSECILNNETVLEKDQLLTVLDRGTVDLLFGCDWNGRTFRLAKEMVQDYYVDVVVEFYPSTITDLIVAIRQCDYIQTKKEYRDDVYHFEAFEMFKISEFLGGENKMLEIQDINGTFCVSSEVLLNERYFAFVKIKETKTTKDFIRSFNQADAKSNLLCFHNDGHGFSLPQGNIKINSIANYEIVYTVTSIERELKYETFPVDKRIKVRRLDKGYTPDHVQVFGIYNSETYLRKLDAIKILMNYDCYAPRFHAYLIIQNQYLPTPKQSGIHLNRKRNISIRESIRKIIKPQLKSSSIKQPAQIRSQHLAGSSHNINTSNAKVERKVSNGKAQREAPIQPDLILVEDENIKCQSNPLYDSTLSLEEAIKPRSLSLPLEIQSKDISSNRMKRRPIEPPLMKSLDQSSFASSSLTDLGTPFSEPLSRKVQYSSDSQLDQIGNRIPYFPARRPLPPPDKQSRPVSPPTRGSPIFFTDLGNDSKKDPPRVVKHVEVKSKEFLYRAQSAPLKMTNPLIAKQMIHDTTDATPPLQPGLNFAGSFDELDGTNEFPELEDYESMRMENYEIMRCKSEPFLNEKSNQNDDTTPIYEEIFISKRKTKSREQELKSLSMIKALTIAEVTKLLRTLKLERHIVKFVSELISGSLLLNLTKEDFQYDLQMTQFEAHKLYEYIHGWRPKIRRAPSSRTLEHVDRDEWSVSDVEFHLKMINLPNFATFCVNNLIDGAFLLHLVEERILPKMERDGIKLTKVEMERLRMYMMKEISYNEQDRILMGRSL